MNRAPKEMLLRVPGAWRNVKRVLMARRHGRLRVADIARLKAPMSKLLPFVLLADHHPRKALDDPAALRAQLARLRARVHCSMPRLHPDAQRWSLRVDPPWSLQAWRDAAREALLRGVAPPQLDWLEGSDTSLLDAPAVRQAPITSMPERPTFPRDFLELAATCLCHRDPQRLALLSPAVAHRPWRAISAEQPADADVLRATALPSRPP